MFPTRENPVPAPRATFAGAVYSDADVLEGIGAALTIVTWADGPGRRGLVPAALSVVSLHPPVIQVISRCLPPHGPTELFIINSFENQDERLRARFARAQGGTGDDPGDWVAGDMEPRLRHASRYCACSLLRSYVGGGHAVYLGCVESCVVESCVKSGADVTSAEGAAPVGIAGRRSGASGRRSGRSRRAVSG
jgi:hypothetical protein